MGSNQSTDKEFDAIIEVAAAMKRAGLHPNREQLIKLLPIHIFLQEQLAKIREELESSVQPSIVFPTTIKSAPGWSSNDRQE